MADVALFQNEADALIKLEKHRTDKAPCDYPGPGGSVNIPLISRDKKEKFILDINRGKVSLVKDTYQNRGRKVLVLVRLDFGGPPHRNPDGTEIPTPHLHIYKEGYGDKWAYLLPTEYFSDIDNPWRLFEDFMSYCNITKPPNINKCVWYD